MIERLANVIYWSATAIAALCIAGGIYAASIPKADSGTVFLIMAGFGVAAWVAGRAVLYILAGK